MTRVKGRLGEWIEAKMRALAAPAIPVPIPVPLLVQKAPPHFGISERGKTSVHRHAKSRRGNDARGHRSSRSR